jgi:hypothetical protein
MQDHPILTGWKRCICGYSHDKNCRNKLSKNMINLEDLLTSSGQHPDRALSDECTDEVKANAQALLDKVNPMLDEIGITVGDDGVSSGFRTAEANAATPGAAKKSNHMIGKAIDLKDHDHAIYDAILAQPDMLKKYGLWMEDARSAPTWCHLDDAERSPRDIQTFLA